MPSKLPRLKQRVKSKMKTNINVRPASEAMMELLAVLFLNNLAQEAKAKAFEERSATIRAHHVKAVAKRVLKNARG
ncbi:centromere protein W-like [Hippocampus comes]|uniref:centromere protein W-like n=1 Tax=Hippocampus comes TaxID=109280 RepID=UPI00094EBB0F|nr:PREDICTED: centromere protein W-like [Hippocampus comes]XP_019745606.1 PREDICTED: centromere protein W-like [Hippocampus comes]